MEDDSLGIVENCMKLVSCGVFFGVVEGSPTYTIKLEV